MDELKDIKKRLKRLEDICEIQALQNRYCTTVDAHNWQAWGALWTENGVFDFPPIGTITGRNAIAKAVEEAEKHFPGMQHSICNLQIEFDGDDNAVGTATLFFAATPDLTKPTECSVVGGPYRFEYVRTDRGWRINRMNLTILWTLGSSPLKPF